MSLALGEIADHVQQGLAVFDHEQRLVMANARYRELLDLPEQMLTPGTPMLEIALVLARRGALGEGDPARLAHGRVQRMREGPATTNGPLTAGGQTLEAHSRRLSDGSMVVSLLNVTARVTAEAELARVNHSLEERVAERTAALTRVNAELELARAAADAANRDKTRFLAAASHDLLQPLNAARLYTSTLVERAGAGAFEELAEAIEASLTAVEDIMTALLDISRIDSGALKPAITEFPVAELLRKVEVEFGPQAAEKSIRLMTVGSSHSIVTDRLLAGRIVQNLVSNAIKYTPRGGRVLVGARARAGKLRLDIIDTGIGFNNDQHALLFAEFSRLERGARMAQGVGLGLSIVQRLVVGLGLTLELDSAEGRGSRFSLILPRGRVAPTRVQPGKAQQPQSGLEGLKVLCVDNERSILDAMDGLLSGWGSDVRTAQSLREISRSQMLDGWYPDLVLMDYHLEQTSGLDAIEWLRQNVGAHLPAALITADRTPEVRQLAEERGVAVITKPVKPAALRAVISRLARPLDMTGAEDGVS